MPGCPIRAAAGRDGGGVRAGRAGTCVYLWSAATSRVVKLCELGSSTAPDSVCSVSWSGRGSYLAIGTNNNQTQIWDANKSQLCACPPRRACAPAPPVCCSCLQLKGTGSRLRQAVLTAASRVSDFCMCVAPEHPLLMG